MKNLFFLISGEFETLSFSELKAIIETENFSYSITQKLDQTVRLKASQQCIKHIEQRSAYTRICAEELFVCDLNDTAIENTAKSICFDKILAKGDTFEVRIRRIKEYATKDKTMLLERKLGGLILQNAPSAKVNLRTPDKTFFGIITNQKLVFGIKLAEIIPKPFVERRARKKPYFHPSAMNAKMARCMVNLAHPKIGDLVLDPFVGTGSTIIESTLIGCKAVGVDIIRKMSKGALKNIRHFNLEPYGVILADARQLPLTKIDCIVTDPPYGKSATTMKSDTKTIVENVLKSSYCLLGKNQHICIASPKTVNISKLGEKYGYRHIESHFAYVHRTLTREVAVFVKE